nr:MAG TPA: hypothetical protein [Caudoviricetes sp.]
MIIAVSSVMNPLYSIAISYNIVYYLTNSII